MFFPLLHVNSVTLDKLLHLVETQFLSEMGVIKIALDNMYKNM